MQVCMHEQLAQEIGQVSCITCKKINPIDNLPSPTTSLSPNLHTSKSPTKDLQSSATILYTHNHSISVTSSSSNNGQPSSSPKHQTIFVDPSFDPKGSHGGPNPSDSICNFPNPFSNPTSIMDRDGSEGPCSDVLSSRQWHLIPHNSAERETTSSISYERD